MMCYSLYLYLYGRNYTSSHGSKTTETRRGSRIACTGSQSSQSRASGRSNEVLLYPVILPLFRLQNNRRCCNCDCLSLLSLMALTTVLCIAGQCLQGLSNSSSNVFSIQSLSNHTLTPIPF